MSECCHRLCHVEAVEAIDVCDARKAGWGLAERRHYELCRAHFDSYFPRGIGFMDRLNATRLRIQCQVMP